MAAFIYILESGSGRFYDGSTTDIQRRMKQHRSGHTHTTKRMDDFTLVFCQEVQDLELARNAERRIKTWKSKDYIAKIVKDQRIKFLD